MNKHVQSVLFVTTSFPRFDGDFAGSFVFRFAKYLVSDGMQVTVLAPGAAGYPATDALAGMQIYRLPYFYPARLQRLAYEGGGMLANLRRTWLAKVQAPLLFFAMVWAIKRYQARFDIIHCHWLPTAVAALVARLCSRTKPVIVLTNWGSDTRYLPAWLTRWTVARVEGCISTAVETDEHLRATGRTEFRRIMAPVDEDRFRRTAVSVDMRYELGIDDNISVIPFVGRLDSFKDPLTFIQACAILRQKGVSFMAPIAGDGDLMAECQQEIQRYQLHNRVVLLGVRKDPERLFRIATSTIHISPIENTWANVIAEAMFMEVPVVLSNVGYTKHLFTHEQNCLIVPAKNPVALAEALQRLIEDEALCTKLVMGAKQLLRQHKKDNISIVREVRTYYDELQSQRAEPSQQA